MAEALLAAIAGGTRRSVFLVHGALALAEPAGKRVAEALAAAGGCELDARRRPPRLGPILDDLRTFSLFGSAKVVLVVDSAVLADSTQAADLIDDAEEALPVDGELSARARPGASRLLQALRLFGIDPFGRDPQATIAALPEWALAGGRSLRAKRPRGRPKKEAEALAAGLVDLLVAARAAGLEGTPEGDLAELSAASADGFPAGHHLVLVERSVASDHPLLKALSTQGAAWFAGELEAERGGAIAGLDALAGELAAETGVGIARDALAELARRTLRQAGGKGSIESDSAARLAGEYRKLSNLARAAGRARLEIDRQMVEEGVEDRGQEDVWKLLDAVGAGRAGEAIDRYRRYMASSEEPIAARLSLFALLAALCRQVAAIRGLMAEARLPSGERNPKRFEERLYPTLTADLATGQKSPLKGLNAFRLFKAYGTACRFRPEIAARLPSLVLETEVQLKGGVSDPDAAFVHFLACLAAASLPS